MALVRAVQFLGNKASMPLAWKLLCPSVNIPDALRLVSILKIIDPITQDFEPGIKPEMSSSSTHSVNRWATELLLLLYLNIKETRQLKLMQLIPNQSLVFFVDSS